MCSEIGYSWEVTTEETDSVDSFRLIETSTPLPWRQKHHCLRGAAMENIRLKPVPPSWLCQS